MTICLVCQSQNPPDQVLREHSPPLTWRPEAAFLTVSMFLLLPFYSWSKFLLSSSSLPAL
jgi:hypothetical protein